MIIVIPGTLDRNEGTLRLLRAATHYDENSALRAVKSLESDRVTKSSRVRAYLGWAHYLSGDETSAAAWWQTAPEESEQLLSYQGDSLIRYSYGDPFFVYNYLPRPTEEVLHKAEKIYSVALQFAPHSSSLLYRLALINDLAGRSAQAEKYYSLAVAENSFRPQDGRIALAQSYFNLGAFAWTSGNRTLACQYMENVLEISPGNTNARTVYYGGWECQ